MFSMKDRAFSISNAPVRAGAPAIGKAVRVLEEVGRHPGSLGISHIARATGLSKSTVHALVSALADEGMLRHQQDTGGYVLGPALARLGALAADQTLLTSVAPILEELARHTGDTALFGRLTGNDVVILARAEGSRPLTLSARVGSSVPVHAGALRKAYLATLDAREAAAFASVTAHDAEPGEVESVRRAGFATERGEYLPGIAAAAAHLEWLGSSYFLWIISVDPVHDDQGLQAAGRAVRDAARRLTAVLETDARTGERSAS